MQRRGRSGEGRGTGLKVLFVSPEIHPLAKTGGLADVAGSLPLALKELGCDVRVVMPRYRAVRASLDYVADFAVPMGRGIVETAVVKEARLEQGVPAYLIECYRYFDRPSLYGYPDDAERFGFFCRAVLEALDKVEWEPAIIHCHDWQSALIPAYLKLFYKKEGRHSSVRTVFTIHNIEYQGRFGPEAMDALGLPWELFNPDGIEFYGSVNLMKAGILFSDIVNTVSESYAREIQTPEFGGGLDGFLRAHSRKLRGILNGLDYNLWDPERDAALTQRFGLRSVGLRARNKIALQRELALPEAPDAFLLGFVSRLTVQKGLDILAPAIPRILVPGTQMVALGTGDEGYMSMMKALAEEYPDNLRVVLDFDDRLARRIYASCDAFLMPSKYEPCGLGQMISLRYGAIPIVRRTGGLADTVIDASRPDGNGFVFDDYTPAAFVEAVERARTLFRDPDRWRALVLRGMAADFSWRASARRYLEVYEEAMGRVE
ncbi:MAG: glycogen synthase GlgA [Thermoplasmata archaeon]